MTKKLIGLYQLITGVFGLVLILFSAMTKGAELFQSQNAIVLIVVGVLLFGLLAWAGYGLLNDIKKAKLYSMFLQAIQIIYIAIPGMLYKFTSAGFISLGFKQGNFALDLSFQPIHFDITSNTLNQQVYAVYIIPIIILFGLIKMK